MGRRLPCLRIRSCSTWKALVFGAGKNDALTLNSQSVRHIRPNTEKTFSTNRKWRDVMGSSGILPHLPGEGCQFFIRARLFSRSQCAGPDLNTQPHNTQRPQTQKAHAQPQTYNYDTQSRHTTTSTQRQQYIYLCACVSVCVAFLRGRWSQGSTHGAYRIPFVSNRRVKFR